MKLLIILIFIITFLYISYLTLTLYYYYKKLRLRLLNQNLDTFKSVLGLDFVFRTKSDNNKRFKWYKLAFIIRASFDKEGNLVESDQSEIGLYKFILQFSIPAKK